MVWLLPGSVLLFFMAKASAKFRHVRDSLRAMSLNSASVQVQENGAPPCVEFLANLVVSRQGQELPVNIMNPTKIVSTAMRETIVRRIFLSLLAVLIILASLCSRNSELGTDEFFVHFLLLYLVNGKSRAPQGPKQKACIGRGRPALPWEQVNIFPESRLFLQFRSGHLFVCQCGAKKPPDSLELI